VATGATGSELAEAEAFGGVKAREDAVPWSKLKPTLEATLPTDPKLNAAGAESEPLEVEETDAVAEKLSGEVNLNDGVKLV